MTSARLIELTRTLRRGTVPLAVAIALTVIFWYPLWTGGGLIGGDIYYYFYPQKQLYAEALAAGEWPLWNNRVGHGYPIVGESQTAVFYPLNPVLYSWLSVNRAYSVSMLIHYVITFVGTWLFARQKGLLTAPALLTALSFTYGWFPARSGLEWAIVTGAWFPVALWLCDCYVTTRRWRYALWLSVVLAVQLLAGHFMLAFLTQLTIVGWIALHLVFDKFFGGLSSAPDAATAASPPAPVEAGISPGRPPPPPLTYQVVLALGSALLLGFALAAVQIGPTWELKQRSQRETRTGVRDIAYGYLPARYLLQTVQPWYWYAYDDGSQIDERFKSTMTPDGPLTNRTEAHLYFGLLPFALAAWGIVAALVSRTSLDLLTAWVRRETWIWLLLGGLALIYATGCLVPLSRHLPGFSFFQGAGRFGLITSLAVALVAGLGLQDLRHRAGQLVRNGLPWLVLVATACDLFWVSGVVPVPIMIAQPPLDDLSNSGMRKHLAKLAQPRLLTPATNAGTLLGVSALPTYLGLSPAAYYEPQLKLPEPIPFETPPTPAQIDWLRRAGVTHLMTMKRVKLEHWEENGKPVLQYELGLYDPLLNRVLDSNLPVRLYRLTGSRGRAACLSAGTAKIVTYRLNTVEIEASAPAATTVVLTDLFYPGWTVTVDGQAATALEIEGLYRGVQIPAGEHHIVWTYRPASLRWGVLISTLALLILLTLGHVRFWQRSI